MVEAYGFDLSPLAARVEEFEGGLKRSSQRFETEGCNVGTEAGFGSTVEGAAARVWLRR
ncbi:helix-turn-helix domain-containing protein [uncultured Jannaschia sp.]|uniref:helix-turn-helix domain-containing protein n=1 Tax=uncultured Jannaschia sp. TaxID=293347 RepID=UPI00260251A4|nr:helix-turn-helix domain-containing protein [uncultured Jannaschia sp.]